MEIWKDIIGYKGLYQVSNLGRIKTFNWKNTGRIYISKGHNSKRGYLTYALVDKFGKRYKTGIHRLVYCIFNNIDFKKYNPLEKTIICHKNDIKTDNRLENLFLGSAKDNSDDMIMKGRRAYFKGENNSYSKLKNEDVINIKKDLITLKFTLKELGLKYNISRHTIGDIKNNRTWKHITV